MKNNLIIGVLLISLFTSCSASKSLKRKYAEFNKGNQHFTGLTVINASNGDRVIDFQGDKYFTPASNVKIFTLYAALTTLTDSVSSFEYFVSGDSLIIKGAADPTFLNDTLHNNSLNFLKNEDVNLYLSDANLNDDVYGAGWSWDDYQYAYMPEKNLMPLFGNTIGIVQDQHGMRVTPSFFKNRLEVIDNYKVARDFNENNFYVSKSAENLNKKVPFITSNQLVADLLSQELNRKVTLINNDPERKYKAFNEVLYDSLYMKMMKESDNFIAEQIMLQVTHKSIQQYRVSDGINYVLDSSLAELPQRPRWVDGSGLSRYNLFSPQSMVYLLHKMYSDIPTEKLLSYFPRGGKDGTLKNDFKEQEYIWAKSGTLSNNYSLSGYLTTKKGNLLIFSYMNNHYMGRSRQRKVEMAAFLKRLHDNY